MNHSPRSYQANGFTLLELLLAIAIFAIVSVLTYSGLNSVIQTSQVTEESADDLKQLQLAMLFVQRDMMQMVARPVNQGSGQLQAALYNTEGNDVLTFSRDGHPNPAESLRSSLQRVVYQLEEDKWLRLSWNHIDHTQNEEPQMQLLLDNMLTLNLRFLNSQKQWQETWQPETLAGRVIALPRAIEINIEHKKWGKIQRIFLISS